MKKFFKYLLIVIIGSITSFFLFFLGIVAIIGIASSGSGDDIKIKDNTVLLLDLSGTISERSEDNPLDAILSGGKSSLGLNDIKAAIDKAAKDDRIKGIYIESDGFVAGFATIEEIRNDLLKFKESGKFIYSFSPVYTLKSYYLASVADKVFLNPAGMLDFQGLSSSRTFYKNLLEKVGVEIQVFKYGEFKSAVEPYILDKMSEPARLQTEVYLNSIWENSLQNISLSRDISVEELKKIAEQVPAFMTDANILATGLIDSLIYKDQMIDILKAETDTEAKNDINAISVSKYHKVYLPGKKKGLERNKIAIIYAEGAIDDGTSTGGINSEKLSRTIRQARRDSSIKAIVMRVNSPGGSGLGSEIIWREVVEAKSVKPFIVSMGDLAASGGYYIAAGADSIVAQPNTLTGSIGVFGMIPNIDKAKKKIGLNTDIVKTNKYADMPNINRSFTKDEKALMQNYINNFYEFFLMRCAEGRNTTTEEIDKVAEGRVWSGENALELNLVDKLGGIDDAIEIAKNMAELETYRVVHLPEKLPFSEQIMKELKENASVYFGKMFFGKELELLNTIKSLENGYPIQARLPYDIEVN